MHTCESAAISFEEEKKQILDKDADKETLIQENWMLTNVI